MILLAVALLLPRCHQDIICGSRQSMVAQNQEIDRTALPRIVDDRQLRQLEQNEELVEIRETQFLKLVIKQQDRRYARPWVKSFLEDMANQFGNQFKENLVVDSLVRTVEQQHQLRRVNRFAAPETGDLPSSHLAGTTVDLAKRRYSKKQRRWIESYLRTMVEKGVAIVANEPYCFHVFVKEGYQ